MLQKILKEKTQVLHDELESLMFVTEIMNKSLSLNQYKKNIIINYIVHKQFEGQLFDALSNEMRDKLDLEVRRKLPSLEKDIHKLNIDEGEVVLHLEDGYQILKNDAFVLGALYVLEGATLGGHVIAKNLANNPNFVNESIPLNYYTVYGDNLIDYWKSFVGLLDEIPEENHHYALKGANMMFEKMIATAKIYNQ